MADKATGAPAPCHVPIGREAFLTLRLTRDPEEAYAAVCRALREHDHPADSLAACSDIIGGHGVEAVTLADGSECLYVNMGDTYDATVCHTDAEGYFVSSWGDVHEAADRAREEDSGERRCTYCSAWAEPGEACGECGRDPETGDPWPDPLRHVRLETGHVLRTWGTGKLSAGRTVVGYELAGPDGAAIFRGADFRPSPLHADDSDATLLALLGFLTLRPGETDREYFDGYTDAQRAFAASSACQTLAWLYSGDGPGTFVEAECDTCGEPMDGPLPEGWRCAGCQRDVGDGGGNECATCGVPWIGGEVCGDCERSNGPRRAVR